MSGRVVDSIVVFASWSGFSPPPTVAKLTVDRRGDAFVGTDALTGREHEVPTTAVAALLEALGRPPLGELDPGQFDYPEPVVRSHFGSIWTNDDPQVLVKIAFADGRRARIHSAAQHAFMLPLAVTDPAGGTVQTFDVRLSRAVAGILPNDCPVKERLAEAGGMLALDAERFAEEAASPPAPPPAEPNRPTNPEAIEAAIHRLFLREETVEEAKEKERTGRESER